MAGSFTRLPALEHHFRETVILAKSCAADQAHLRSHAGAGASVVVRNGPLARVCRDTGTNGAIEVLASGLPIHHGARLAVDVTMRCALTAQGLASPGAAHINGAAALSRARCWQPLCSGCRGSRDGWSLEQRGCGFCQFTGGSPGTGCTSVASPFFVLGLASPLVEDARCVLWQGVCQLLNDLLLRHA